MRLHLSQLAGQAGHVLDVTRTTGPAWMEASIRGFEGGERPLANLIVGAITPNRWLRPDDALAELTTAAEQGSVTVRMSAPGGKQSFKVHAGIARCSAGLRSTM